VLYKKKNFSPASPLYLFESDQCPALLISIPAESPAGEWFFARSQLHTSVIVISHSLNMRLRQAGASRMIHCLAADACEFICEVSAAVQGIKTFKSLPEKHRSHPKNPARSARFLVTARRLRWTPRKRAAYAAHLLVAHRSTPRCDQKSGRNLPPKNFFHPKFGPGVEHWLRHVTFPLCVSMALPLP
jgi:hypothetical protein